MQSIDTLINALTLEEKIRLCAGKDFWRTVNIERLGIPSIMMNDGPHGVRATSSADIIVTDNQRATCFPTGSALASTWNEKLVDKVAAAIGFEAQHHGIHLLLGPGINLKRSPLGGRNFEYFSEDPYLTAVLATAYVNGLQKKGVGACLKHFVCNEQEIERMTIDCTVAERALREVYAQPFAACIEHANPAAIMSAYNKLNGEKLSESTKYLKELLRETLGFQGAIVSDWGAINDVPAAMRATADLDMPNMGNEQFDALHSMVTSGALSETDLNGRVRRILALVLRLAKADDEVTAVDFDTHYQIAREAAAEAMVLLKNDAGTLPLNPNLSAIGVVGALFQEPRIQGGGSSKVLPYRTTTPAAALSARYPQLVVDYAAGYDNHSMAQDETLLEAAKQVVGRNTINVLFLGLLEHEETEGKDRADYALSEQQQRLVETLLTVDPHLIVVLNNGTAVTFRAIKQVKTLVEAWLPGAAMGDTLVDILFGEVNPSGKLSETFPLRQADFPLGTAVKSGSRHIHYSESVLIGHRYYDYKELAVTFPFGHGLSYTEFAYGKLKLSAVQMSSEQTLAVSFEITNIGKRAGKEIAQLYIEPLQPQILKPVKTLRKFKKVLIHPGERPPFTSR